MDPLNRSIEKGPARWLVLFLESLSALNLMARMLITSVDVAGRYQFNNPSLL